MPYPLGFTPPKIALKVGRTVSIIELHQSPTVPYYAQIFTPPTKSLNERLIAGSVEVAKKRWGMDPCLIEPPETPIAWERDRGQGPPVMIPDVTCHALLESDYGAKDPKRGWSHVAIVWFQNNYAMPIEESVIGQIALIEWDRWAEDWDF